MTTAFLELTTKGVAEDENYTAVTSLSSGCASTTTTEETKWTALTLKISDPSLFQPVELSSVPLAEHARVIFDVAVADIPKVQMACVLSGLVIYSERKTTTNRDDCDRRVLTATKTPQESNVKSRPLPLNNTINKDETILMIDEDDLLQDEGDWAPDTTTTITKSKTAADDCGGREPCDNCTCGRGGGGAATAAGGSNQNVPPATSNCGKCGMGDAFRCASCPFLGKPAFKPGQEHLVLDLQDDL